MEKLGAEGLLTYQQTRQMLELASKGNSNKSIMLPGKTCAVYSYGRLTVTALERQAAATEPGYAVSLAELRQSGVLRLELPQGILSLGYLEGSARPSGHAAAYPWHLLQCGQLEVRQRREGDRFFRPGRRAVKN